MSLLDEFREPYAIMERTRVPDGEGGTITTWSAGVTIEMALQHDTTLEARRAAKEGVTDTYTFLAPRGCGLVYHDYVRRVSDSKIFRITSDAGESVTPGSSGMALTALTAEEADLPT